MSGMATPMVLRIAISGAILPLSKLKRACQLAA
jgi:hypothetical protein